MTLTWDNKSVGTTWWDVHGGWKSRDGREQMKLKSYRNLANLHVLCSIFIYVGHAPDHMNCLYKASMGITYSH